MAVSMRGFQRVAVAALAVTMILTLSGCVYYENKPWGALTEEEKQTARETFQETREELEETVPSDTLPGKFADFILNGVQQGLEE